MEQLNLNKNTSESILQTNKKPISLLYVDDEPDLLMLGKLFLERSGDYKVDIQESALEALNSSLALLYDAIISDYQMPEMDGIEFLKVIRERFGDIPFILFTGRGREEVVIEAINNGADFYIQKGGDPKPLFAELSHKVKQAVRRKQAEDERIIQFNELVKTKEALMESENRFRGMAERSSDLIIILNKDLIPTYVSPSSRSIIGYDPEELLSKSPEYASSTIFSQSGADLIKSVYKTINGEIVENVEIQITKKDGAGIYVNLHAIPVILEGVLTGVQVSMRDITHIKKTELALRDSEEKFVTIFQNNPVPLTLVSATTGQFTDVNFAFEQNSGYTKDEVIGKTPGDLQIIADIGKYEQLSSDLRKNHLIRGMDILCRAKNGEMRNCRFSSSLFLIHGQPQILSSIEDITKKRATESAMKVMVKGIVGSSGKDSFDQITESIRNWLSADSVIIGEISSNLEQIHILSKVIDGKKENNHSFILKGTPYEETIQNGFSLYPENLSTIFSDCDSISENQFQSYVGSSLKKSDGTTIGVLGILSRTAINPGVPIKDIIDIIAVKAGADIERSHIEQILVQNERLLADTMEMAKLVSWQYDESTQVFTFNDRFYELYGTTAEREGGYFMSPEKYVTEFIHPADIPRIIEERKQSIDSSLFQNVVHHEHRIIRRDGEVRRITVRARLIHDDEGNIVTTLGATQDITEQKNIEDAILKANRQLNLLTTVTREDILNKMSVFDQHLKTVETQTDNPMIISCIQKIHAEIRNIRTEIDFLKEYETLGSHKPLWISLETSLPRSTIPNSIHLFDTISGISVLADPMIDRVFSILLDNSLSHAISATEINVFARTGPEGLTIVWEDNGVGIPAEEKNHIFERGYGISTGNGLFFAREILLLTGIDIQETGTPGKGVRFEISVPPGSYVMS